jgi:hypothetical protein
MAGRGRALEALDRALPEGGDAQSLVLVAGEPGIGKTRLVSEFAGHAHRAGSIVLYGRSTDGPDPPYRPFAEALEHYLRHAPQELVAQEEADLRELARIVPAARDRLPGMDLAPRAAVEADRFVLFAAATSIFRRAAEAAPLVLILEDLHWADEGSLLLLRHLMSGPAEIPVLTVGTYRPTDRGPESPLSRALADLTRDRHVSRLELEALSREDGLLLLTEIAGRGLKGFDAEVAGELHRESGGNPLFLSELVRAMVTAGGIREEEGRWTIKGNLRSVRLPATLTDLIKERVVALGSEVSEALAAASIIGEEFDPELVEVALGKTSGQMAPAWDAAERTGLVVEPDAGGLAFNHPLVERALYEGLGPRHRGALHRSMAEAMESRGREADAPEIARHWAEAAPEDPERACAWAARAGQYALDHFDASAAVEWYGRALKLRQACGSDEAGRCELLVGLGAAQRQHGGPEFRDTLLEAARLAERLGSDELLIAAVLLNNRGFASTFGGVDAERVAMLEAALRAAGEADTRERALLLATLGVELTYSGDLERRVEMSSEAVAIARRLGDRSALATSLTLRSIAIWTPETLEERLAATAEAVRLADERGDPWSQFHATHWRFASLLQAGAVMEAADVAERERKLSGRLGDPTSRWISTFDNATLAIVAGRLDEAEELAQRAAGIVTGSGYGLPMFTSQLTSIRYEQGRLSELQPLIAQVVAENPRIPAFRAILALSYVEGDLHDRARDLLAEDLRTGFADVEADPTWLAAHALYAHVAADLGGRRAAAALYERLEPWSDQIVYVGAGAWGDVDHALGRLATVTGELDVAEQHLASALDRSARIGAPIWTARAQLDTARMLVDRGGAGDQQRAGELLSDAIRGAGRLGAATVERRARSLSDHQRAMEIAGSRGPSGRRLHMRAVQTPPAPEPAAVAGTPPGAHESSGGTLERQGDYWVMRLDGSEVRLRESKGITYLAQLLANAGLEIHAVDLQSGENGRESSAVATDPELAVRAAGSEDAGVVLDAEAKRRYRARVEELRDQIEEAERFNDLERASRAREELEFVGRELAAAVGIGGRDRKAASQAERARVNVTRALRGTVKRIADHDAALGGHLEASVQTGVFCVYAPPPGQAVEWKITRGPAGP